MAIDYEKKASELQDRQNANFPKYRAIYDVAGGERKTTTEFLRQFAAEVLIKEALPRIANVMDGQAVLFRAREIEAGR